MVVPRPSADVQPMDPPTCAAGHAAHTSHRNRRLESVSSCLCNVQALESKRGAVIPGSTDVDLSDVGSTGVVGQGEIERKV